MQNERQRGSHTMFYKLPNLCSYTLVYMQPLTNAQPSFFSLFKTLTTNKIPKKSLELPLDSLSWAVTLFIEFSRTKVRHRTLIGRYTEHPVKKDILDGHHSVFTRVEYKVETFSDVSDPSFLFTTYNCSGKLLEVCHYTWIYWRLLLTAFTTFTTVILHYFFTSNQMNHFDPSD